jgi:hypothetical protein
LIVAGDFELVVTVLKSIQARESELGTGAATTLDSEQPRHTSASRAPDGSIDLSLLSPNKPLATSETVLEFLLLALCQSMSLTPKQSAGMLTSGNKYLTSAIVKGMKRQFAPIETFYRAVHTNLRHLVGLVAAEAKADPDSNPIRVVISALKPGFMSVSNDVVSWT